NTVAEIARRKRSNDFLLCAWDAHQYVASHYNDMIVVETGIGYGRGHFAPFKIFESYAMLHAYYGSRAVMYSGKMDWFDVVIPNYFDPADFEFSDQKEDWLLFLGRVYEPKGIYQAIAVAETTRTRLKVAGPGPFRKPSPFVDYEGFAWLDKRRMLLSKAKAVIMPSIYVEPFGGVQVEAMMSGTPVISPDWGAFVECNLHGITGYRCRSLEQFCWAVNNIHCISPHTCRQWAESNYSMDRIAAMYQEYFEMIMRSRNKDWNVVNPERRQLDWLKKHYPAPPMAALQGNLPMPPYDHQQEGAGRFVVLYDENTRTMPPA
ncbi:MAG TPA: glycosyltransferase, partial [Anaerolineae bacterium]|nr:glycosyltransferase [Anaerolineae bacterium]